MKPVTRCIALLLSLGLPLAASASVTYSYASTPFTSISVSSTDPAVEAALRAQYASAYLSASLTLPTYLPTGWNTLSNSGIGSPALVAALSELESHQGLPNPAINWDISSNIAGFSGTVALHMPPPGVPDYDPVFSFAVHVGANNQIDAWTLKARPSPNDWSDPTYHNSGVDSSNSAGDAAFYVGGRFETSYVSGNSGTPGSWSVTTSVPEASSSAMMLGGLGLIGMLARRRKNKAAAA